MDEEKFDLDAVDVALQSMIDSFVTIDSFENEDEYESAWDEFADEVYEIAEEMVNRGEISDIPDDDSSDADKESWVAHELPKLKEAVIKHLESEDEIESEDEDGDSDLE